MKSEKGFGFRGLEGRTWVHGATSIEVCYRMHVLYSVRSSMPELASVVKWDGIIRYDAIKLSFRGRRRVHELVL